MIVTGLRTDDTGQYVYAQDHVTRLAAVDRGGPYIEFYEGFEPVSPAELDDKVPFEAWNVWDYEKDRRSPDHPNTVSHIRKLLHDYLNAG